MLVLVTIPQSITIYLIPQESKNKKNKKIKIFSIGISCLIAIVSIITIPYGINSLLPQYEDSIIPMQIISIGVIPLVITSIQNSEFLGKENSRVVLFGSVIQSGLYFMFIILLGHAFGLVGFASGFVIAVFIRVIFNALIKNVNIIH